MCQCLQKLPNFIDVENLLIGQIKNNHLMIRAQHYEELEDCGEFFPSPLI